MTFKTIYEKYICLYVAAFSLCTAYALHYSSLLDSGLNSAVLIMAGIIFTGFFTAFDIMRAQAKRLHFYGVFAGFVAVTAAVVIFTGIPVTESMRWLLFSRDAEADYAFTYSLISLTVLLLTITGAAFNLLRFRYVRLAAGIAVAVFCVVMAVLEENTGIAPTFLLFIFIFIVLHEWLLKEQRALTYLLPFIIITGLMTALLPSKQEPVRWEVVMGIIRGVRDAAVSLGEQLAIGSGRLEFGLNMTGYTESGRIGGGITTTGNHVLEVRNIVRSGSHVYLTGTVMDNYTGSGWTRRHNFDEFSLPEYRLDFIEMILALHNAGVFDLSAEERGAVYEMRDMGIRYLSLRTRTLFYPLKVYSIRADYTFNSFGSSMFFSRTAGGGTEYRVQYIDLNYDSEVLISLLSDSAYRRTDLNVLGLNNIIRGYFPNVILNMGGIPEDFADVLERRRGKIYEVYTELPATVPASVYELAREITAGYGSDYAKMSAIEHYLANNFTYTKTPPLLPDGDFTAAFLFDMREGYCTYFATAAAVLGRAAGVPTRYVQGFSVEAETMGTTRSYIVNSDRAHAWVEAYIDGAGWIPFEPSPTFEGGRYGDWVNRRIEQPQSASLPPEPSREPAPSQSTTPQEEHGEAEQRLEQERRNVYIIVLVIGGSVVLTGGIAILAGFIITARRMRKRYMNSSPTQRFLHDYNIIMLLLELAGKAPEPGETAGHFAARTGDETFTALTVIFESARYGDKEVAAIEAATAAVYKEQLLSQSEGLSIIRKKTLILRLR